jgi:hypothetical protein
MTGQRIYPPFHIDADAEALGALGQGITSLVPVFNHYQSDDGVPRAHTVWVKDNVGTNWAIGVHQRDLEFKFEVFSLTIENEAALKARIETGSSIAPPSDAQAFLAQAAIAPRVAPVAPEDFQPLPFKLSQVYVLRRAEFILSDVDLEATLGENPVLQTAAMPKAVPSNVEAYCIVSVGLLMTGLEGQRLLVGVDWFPFDLIMSTDSDFTDSYTAACEMIDINAYAEMLRS